MMQQRRRAVVRLVGLGLWPLASTTPEAQAQPATLRIGGTGAGVGVLERWVSLLGLSGTVSILPSLGTSGGLKALGGGAIDVALAARPLTSAETGAGLVAQPLFRTPLVWAVNGGVERRQASMSEIVSWYRDAQARWNDGMPVRLILRPESDGDTQFAKALSPAFAEALVAAHARPGVLIATTDTDASEALDRVPGSLGVTTLTLLNAERRRARALTIDGITPDLDSMRDRRWQHVKTVYVVTKGRPEGAAAALLERLRGDTAGTELAALGGLASA